MANLLWAAGTGQNYFPAWGRPGTSSEGLAWYPTDFTRDVVPIPCHSHNDYWRQVPLFSAVRAGCTGVEADVWHFAGDDALYVGHNTASLTTNRTLLSLYVNPLLEMLERQNPRTPFYNGTRHGLFDAAPEQSLVLLIDLKTDGRETWPHVTRQLAPLRDRGWLTRVENGTVVPGPITVVGTGNTPFDLVTANATYRDTFFDAPLDTMWEAGPEPADPDLDRTAPHAAPDGAGQGQTGTTPDSNFTAANSYYASVSFTQAVGFMWRDGLSAAQMRIIRGQIRGAHRRGLKVRYWNLPSWPIGWRNHVWDVLVREGVDMLNVDDLRAAAQGVW